MKDIEDKYDVVIVGAGIQGAGIAQAMVAAGYSVLVLEQYSEPAMGTSRYSSKLIHGGLRYLETAQFQLVYECLKERKILLDNAPNLVKLKPFYIPVYKKSKRSFWVIWLGLVLYYLLSGFSKYNKFKIVKKSIWKNFSGLNQENLLQVFEYNDAQTDDAVLTRSVLDSAIKLGAIVKFNAIFRKAEKLGEGYKVFYTRGEEVKSCCASVLINAAGPWVNNIANKVDSFKSVLPIDLIQGTHIILPEISSNDWIQGIYYLEAPQDKRAVFVMPWKKNIMVGTTEILYTGDPANVQATKEEVRYLLDIFNYYFPKIYSGCNASITDIVGTFSGLRVLPQSNNSAFGRSRETIFKCDNERFPRFVTIYGGKLTSYRATAVKVVNLIKQQLPSSNSKADTRNINLE